MTWPQAPDYVEVVQNLALAVRDEDLQRAIVINNSIGLPSTRCGSFATVFHLRSPDHNAQWALKCFTRQVADLRRRYDAIGSHLKGHAKLPFMVDFRYLEEGILVRGRWYSVLKMDWVEGLRLDDFLDDCLKKDSFPTRLQTLSRMWVRLARMLREAQVGHGDLQHGNVILVPLPERNGFQLKLIDYDGMFVPALEDQSPGEIGHPAFQHPQRSVSNNYGVEVDHFSHLLIYWTLRCLSIGGRALWERYRGDDRLLIDQQDLHTPEGSRVLRELWRFSDPDIQSLTGHLILAVKSPLDRVPALSQLVTHSEIVPLSSQQQQQIERWFQGPTMIRNGQSSLSGSGTNPIPTDSGAVTPVAPAASARRPRQGERHRRRSQTSGPARTHEQRLLEWIKTGTKPTDHYELLGLARCHPRREDLLAAVRECNRVLHECQNHQDSQRADRAIRLQRQVAEALSVFSDDSRWQQYNVELVERWRDQYAAKNGRDPAHWRPEGLRRWLAIRMVHPARLDEIAGWMQQPNKTDEPPPADEPAEPHAGPARPTSFRNSAFPRDKSVRGPKKRSGAKRTRSRRTSSADAASDGSEHARSSTPRPGTPTGAYPAPGQRPPPARMLPRATADRSKQTGGGWIWWMVGSVAVSILLGILAALSLLAWLFW